MQLNASGLMELGMNRHLEGRGKLMQGKRGNFVNNEGAAILAAQSIGRVGGMTNVACELYQYYVCRMPKSHPQLLKDKVKIYDTAINETFFR